LTGDQKGFLELLKTPRKLVHVQVVTSKMSNFITFVCKFQSTFREVQVELKDVLLGKTYVRIAYHRLSMQVFNLDEKTSGLDCRDRLKYLASDVSPFLLKTT